MKLSLPDQFEKLATDDPRAAFDFLLSHLSERLPYRIDRGALDAIKLALRIAWTLGQRDGIRSVIEETLEAKETQRHDH